jgi:hypothetical protein
MAGIPFHAKAFQAQFRQGRRHARRDCFGLHVGSQLRK